MPSQITVPLKSGSDADATHRPVGTAYVLVNPPTLYLEKLAHQWMQARGETRPGMTYILEALPAGYALYQKPRVSNPSHVDKWLYGHPGHKPFDSPNRFFPHFQHLMENDGSSIGCPCTVCNSKGGVLTRLGGSRCSSKRSSRGSSSGGSSACNTPLKRKLAPVLAAAPAPPSGSFPFQPKGRPEVKSVGTDTSRVDEEGTPDVYRNLIDKLKRHGTLDEAVLEPLSMDWRAEQSMLPGLLRSLEEEPQWIPRVGDIVLYTSEIPVGFELLQHEHTGRYVLWDPDTGTAMGEPIWQAGLVGQTPVESVTTEDAVRPSEKQTSVSLSGVRIEPLPNPNDSNKAMSKRYRYVPVHQTRPFILWKDYLGHLSEEQWHPTIKNALTVMATMSLFGKHRFRGHWPDAQIYCHGIYIGSEMFVVGDTVRLLPKGGETTCTNIIVIKSVRLKLASLDKASANDYDEGRPYNSEVWIYGSAYSTDSSYSSKGWFSAAKAHTLKSATGYSKWFPLHPENKELAVPFFRILGRLFEQDTMNLWLPASDARNLEDGKEGLLEARDFARANDNRIALSLDAAWFWGDSRSEALDLQTINGRDVSKHDAERDPFELRKRTKITEGVGQGDTRKDAQAVAGGARGLRAFMVPAAAALPMRATFTQEQGSVTRSTSTSELSNNIDWCEEEDEEEEEAEIRQQMRVVDHVPNQKKAKVMVVID